MSKEPTSVPEIFRRAMELARGGGDVSLRDVTRRLFEEFKDSPMPPLSNLTFPEQDALAPHEDWTAGLSIVRRGIQREDWREIISGVAMSVDQTIRYERERGHMGQSDDWHDRTTGIEGALDKGVSKWMPEELMRLAERAGKK
jgi:hypothetical protein